MNDFFEVRDGSSPIPEAGAGALGPPSPAMRKRRPKRRLVSSFDPWIEIHRENLTHNVNEIRRRAGGRPILAVIKNNGYGLGLENAARLLEPPPAVAGFAVVKLQEVAEA
jgi:hypothetical protein